MNATLRVGGIVLCGGESRRMGTPKAWLPFGDEYLLQRILGVLAQAASPVVLATRRGTELPPLSQQLRVVHDSFEQAGPLGGIAEGMIALRGHCDAVLVLGCDHPFVSAAVLHRLIERLGDENAVVPRIAEMEFPTLALYRLSTLEILENLLSQSLLRARDFALQCNPVWIGEADLADVDPELRSFCNVNTLAEYRSALAAAGSSNTKGPI